MPFYVAVSVLRVPLCENLLMIAIVPQLHVWQAERGGVYAG